jgi:RHS repeat-associated protein
MIMGSGAQASPPTAPTQPTYYVYDVLNDLTTVTQGTQPSRVFVYDSLKRLMDATNPESGHVHYTYDENGNLKTKIDARSITTTYFYDALNRGTSRIYMNDPQSTPAVTYVYDASGVLYSKGRLTQVTSSVSTYDYLEYDQLGRVKQSKQTTLGGAAQGYTFSNYSYNLAGEMISETYPSGRVVATEYDSAGRVAGVRNQGAPSYYAGAAASDATNRIQYAAQGAVSVMKLGNGKWEHTNFNSRLQPTQIGIGTSATNSSILKLDYGYGTTTNNGNVLTQTITIGATVMSQSYGYDTLNRLQTASEGSAWQQTYDCDRYSNRAVRTGSFIPQPQLTPQSSSPIDFSAFTQGSNRIALAGFGYDTAGNLTADPTTAANAMIYDAENRQASYTKAGVTTTYTYDGDGRRVKKVDSTGTIIFVYNAAGQLIAEYTSGTPTGSGTSYLTSDHLGSTRAVTKSDGTVKARYDYIPFGEELGAGIGQRTTGMGYNAADSTKQKFTQKERDNESGLDYFGARYYSGALGRFTSSDPIQVTAENFVNPQRWNLYVYVNNNPLGSYDPNGADGEGKGGDKVISVFLAFKRNERNTNSRNGPGWEATKQLAKRNGYKLEVYGSPDVAGKGAPAATGESFEKALQNSDVVIFVGHGVGSRDAVPFSPSFFRVGDTGYHPDGSGPVGPGAFGPETLATTRDRPEASAGVICNFSCNSVQNYDLFENTAGLIQTQVVVNGGSDGLTAVGTLEKAANAFVQTYVTPNGSVADAVSSANRVINERVKGNMNEDDRVEVRLKVDPPH